MKALVYTAPNEVRYRDEPDPVRADGEVMIAIDAVGICGSDLHAYHGHDPRRVPPMILGHELAGRIVEGPGHRHAGHGESADHLRYLRVLCRRPQQPVFPAHDDRHDTAGRLCGADDDSER